jgi:hypothetical protein
MPKPTTPAEEREADPLVASQDFLEALVSLRALEKFYRARGDTERADYMHTLLGAFSIHHIDGNRNNNAPANCRVVWNDRNERSRG